MRDYRSFAEIPAKKCKKPTAKANRVKHVKQPRKPVDWGKCRCLAARILKPVLAAVSVVLICYGSTLVMTKFVLFPLERIDVKGTLSQLKKDEIISISGASHGESLLSLKIKRMGELVGKNPWISSVRIHRYFPDSLTIDVTERKPVAIVNLGYLYYLDSKGEIFKPVSTGEPIDFPVVTGLGGADGSLDLTASKEVLQTVLGLVELLNKGSVIRLDDVSEIHYDKGNGFTIFALEKGVPIRLGHGDFPAKFARLSTIFAQLSTQPPAPLFIDLDYADRIIVRRS